MTGLAEFLLARIAEDEEAARDSLAMYGPGSSIYINRHDPARVLAECDAKRRIVQIHSGGEHLCPSAEALEDGLWSVTDQDVMRPCPTLRLLALPYAAHPDYEESWAP